jgi:hypothetical protein
MIGSSLGYHVKDMSYPIRENKPNPSLEKALT